MIKLLHERYILASIVLAVGVFFAFSLPVKAEENTQSVSDNSASLAADKTEGTGETANEVKTGSVDVNVSETNHGTTMSDQVQNTVSNENESTDDSQINNQGSVNFRDNGATGYDQPALSEENENSDDNISANSLQDRGDSVLGIQNRRDRDDLISSNVNRRWDWDRDDVSNQNLVSDSDFDRYDFVSRFYDRDDWDDWRWNRHDYWRHNNIYSNYYQSYYNPYSYPYVYAANTNPYYPGYIASYNPYVTPVLYDQDDYYHHNWNNWNYRQATIRVIEDRDDVIPYRQGYENSYYDFSSGSYVNHILARNLVLENSATSSETLIHGNGGFFRPMIQHVRAVVSDAVYTYLRRETVRNPFSTIVLNVMNSTISFRDWMGHWITRPATIYV